MAKMRPATLMDLVSISATRRRQRVLRLNPPYTLVQPEALLGEMLLSQAPTKLRSTFIYTYVERGVVLGYVQARCRWHRRDEWTVTTLATLDSAPEHVLEALLEEVCRAAGEAGVIRLFAKVPGEEGGLPVFRQLGFTHYTDEHIWGNLYFSKSGAPADEPVRRPLRAQRMSDAWDIMQLYAAITPPAVQRAEMLTSRQWQRSHLPKTMIFSRGLLERSYVWSDESGLSVALGGYARLLTGPSGHWITMLARSDNDNRAICPAALDYLLWKAARQAPRPVYCGFREYQSELAGVLESRGFHPLSTQSLLVKYLAEPIKEKQPALVPFLVPKREMVAGK